MFGLCLAEENILGTWHNPEQTLRFDSDGTITDLKVLGMTGGLMVTDCTS